MHEKMPCCSAVSKYYDRKRPISVIKCKLSSSCSGHDFWISEGRRFVDRC